MSLSDSSLSISISSSDDEYLQPEAFKTRINPMLIYNDEEFKNRYRLNKNVILFLLSQIESKIKPFTLRNRSISALEQLLLTVNFYATEAFQITVADHMRVHKSTACRIIKKVSEAIAQLGPKFIAMPRTEEELNKVKGEFYSIQSFPNVIGAVGCTHIKIQSPGGVKAKLYKNSKGFFSLNVQIISDANLKIMDVICRHPGSAHNTTIMNNSKICVDFESGVYGSDYLLGNDGYPCRSYLLTPFLHPSTPSEEVYNQAHFNTRNAVERCFSVLKRRFPCLSKGLRVRLETTINIIVACCVLHNLAIMHNDNIDDISNLSTDFLETLENQAPIASDVSASNENISVRASLLLTHFHRYVKCIGDRK